MRPLCKEKPHYPRQAVVFKRVHRILPRFNKAQQDAFLPHVESGLFTFIGATTENPSFEVNSALLSRATVHVLKSLDAADLIELLGRAQTLLAAPPLSEAARDRLVAYADGDARRLLNAYENLVEMATLAGLAEYWFVRMLDGGVDPRYAARRLVRIASEDIGLADPRALRLALDAAETYERLGSPEGELALAQAVIYLAMAPKSNAVYRAYKAARAFIEQDGTRAVPLRLRNAPTRLMKDLDYGSGYRYAHDEEDGFAAGERYWPDDVAGPRFYEPVARGLEIRIGEKLEELRRLDAAARKAR